MKSQQDIERALTIMELAADSISLSMDERVAHHAIMDFARWVLDLENHYGPQVFDPHVKEFPNLPPNKDSFAE